MNILLNATKVVRIQMALFSLLNFVYFNSMLLNTVLTGNCPPLKLLLHFEQSFEWKCTKSEKVCKKISSSTTWLAVKQHSWLHTMNPIPPRIHLIVMEFKIMSTGFKGNGVFSHKEKQWNAELRTLSQQTSIVAALATSCIRINLFYWMLWLCTFLPCSYKCGRYINHMVQEKQLLQLQEGGLLLCYLWCWQDRYMCSFSFPPDSCYLNLCDKKWTVTGQSSHQCMPDFQSHMSTAMTGCIQASSNLHVVSESLTMHSPPSRALPWDVMGLGLKKRTRPAVGNVYEIGRLPEKEMESGFMDSTGAVCCCRFWLELRVKDGAAR